MIKGSTYDKSEAMPGINPEIMSGINPGIRQEIRLVKIHKDSVCILGCTKLPVLYEKYRDKCMDVRVFDPAYLALKQIRKEL